MTASQTCKLLIMDINAQFKTAEKEAAVGLKNKAANRLRLVIKKHPDVLEAREHLAQLYYDSGFFDLAGLYWYLSEPTPERQKCVAIYLDSVQHSPVQVWRDLKYRGDTSTLPDFARNKLETLREQKNVLGKSSREYNTRNAQIPESPELPKWRQNINSLGCYMILIIIAVTFFVGMKEVVNFIDGLFKSTVPD
jgi:hypothetical protein